MVIQTNLIGGTIPYILIYNASLYNPYVYITPYIPLIYIYIQTPAANTMEVSGERKKPPTKEDVVEGFLRCNLRVYVGPMWGQVGPLAGDIRLMFGKFGACWGYLVAF